MEPISPREALQPYLKPDTTKGQSSTSSASPYAQPKRIDLPSTRCSYRQVQVCRIGTDHEAELLQDHGISSFLGGAYVSTERARVG